MGAPRMTVVRQVHPGEYCHTGPQSALSKYQPSVLQEELATIEVQLHIGGKHPSGSSQTRLCTIFGCVAYPTTTPPPPKQLVDMNIFLEDLVLDVAGVQRNEIKLKVIQNGKWVQLVAVTYDYLPTAFVKCKKSQEG
ncbi:hypothetical protein FGIG_12072 [Fasciola gigantica]|uniref:Uncharacterized protein n=1 Tax=Fasciola gigantica TaxID=46835 RepID=A0A504YGV4_FASGI|nr:hypothetical protein FGIG_12072 [Fasciola gigantica]